MSGERLLTPSKITAWLDCEHYLTLRHQLEDGSLELPPSHLGEFARLLMDKGDAHERQCLAQYEDDGLTVTKVPDRLRGEHFHEWTARVGDPFVAGADVVFQVPFVHDGMRGIADFVRRTTDTGAGIGWEPVDAKLARNEAKAGHVLQLCFYAEAIEAETGTMPERVHLWLGSGRIETFFTRDVLPYWRRLRLQLRELLDREPTEAKTVPVPCSHCAFCEFDQVCEQSWRAKDAIHYVAGIRSRERDALAAVGVTTLSGLAAFDGALDDVAAERLDALVDQAALQLRARKRPGELPPVSWLDDVEAGFGLLPEPDEGDIFLDFEGHPFWSADRSLFFLFGYLAKDGAEWRYHELWAHDVLDEATITRQLVDLVAERRDRFPGMHVYHYNHTERSSLERLAAEHGTRESALTELVETGCFVDLLDVVHRSLRAGVESYGLKNIERLAGYERGHDIDQGAGAVVEYERYCEDEDSRRLERIGAYNDDDVRATKALRDWLVEQRPGDVPWRAAWLEADATPEELDEQVEQLMGSDDASHHLIAHVLGFWLREWLAHKAPLLSKCGQPTTRLLDDPTVITGLEPVELLEPTGKQKHGSLVLEFPEQELGPDLCKGASLMFSSPDGLTGYSTIRSLGDSEVTIGWSERSQELGAPTTVAFDGYYHPGPKVTALNELAQAVIDSDDTDHTRAALALLRRARPSISPAGAPADGRFSTDLDACGRWVEYLDNSVFAVQGPPGTGKTYRGARVIRHLLGRGKRVGITATSYVAIDNLVEAVCDAYDETGDSSLRAIRKKSGVNKSLKDRGVEFGDNNKCATDDFDLVAGTSWLFASNAMAANPVDVLVIDEAGQYSLADTLAALRSAKNLLLLGDPLQLPHVSQAVHPEGSGESALAHVLGDNRTLPDDLGVFLDETWRMHPDICGFISDQIYEGRLRWRDSCTQQTTAAGTGLRWLRADHQERSTESPGEAALVAGQVASLLGANWTDQHGVTRPMTVDDLMVVAPYNDQVRLLREELDAGRSTAGVPVGTVDKFQGQEAAVVFFSMATSSYDDMPRGPEFLFSANRLNVAISRARCLAYLVCTEDILNSRARSVEDMKLISNLCAFVERAT